MMTARTAFKLLLVFTTLLVFAGSARADSTLFINVGVGFDPDLIHGNSFTVTQNSGGAGTISTLDLLFSVAGVTSMTSPISGVTSSAGTAGTPFLAGVLAYTTPPASANCKNSSAGLDAYSCAGFVPPPNSSNNLSNFVLVNTNLNGITGSTYGIYEVEITGLSLGGKDSITITGNFPIGTFVDAFGVDNTGATYGTPFTQAGLEVPEPASMGLLAFGLLSLVSLGLRRDLPGND